MRQQIEAGATQLGLLAGSSYPRLSRAIVAIHDGPGQVWRNEDLAYIAGMSLNRFAEIFLAEVGEPPAAYLRRWKLTLARQDIGLVAVWFRSFDSVMCSKEDDAWAQSGRMNFARMRCGSR
jgi:hypothetical protein